MRLPLCVLAIVLFAGSARAQYLGNFSGNAYAPNSTGNQFGEYGSPFGPGINNPYSQSGSQFSPSGVRNPYATQAPKLYDNQGGYHGRLSSNPYAPDSVSNPFGKYGSPYSPDSINNKFGRYGSPYSPDSPNNPYGQGLHIEGAQPPIAH
ncbi:MAG: hypothetical protein IVW54_10755 [Candidatus Binataceae bacterium]|nr:hypothetical protein [Candidatus Binataceae bacterium]